MSAGEKIPFMELTRQYASIKDEIKNAVDEVFESAQFSGGPFVEKFEREFADYCQTKFSVAVNSGTAALHLALLALDIKTGDEVIVPANTFFATAAAVSVTGAAPVFVDCDAQTWNIDGSETERKITSKTKAIIGVHLYGQPCNIDALKKLCAEKKIHFIEDAAQAHGASWNEKKVGGFGTLGCFSFYPGKNLGAYGEGGAVTTNDESLANRIQKLKNHGSLKKYFHDEVGFNMRMEGIQAAILSVKLRHLEKWNERRRQIARIYKSGISNKDVRWQQQPENISHACHLFVITVRDRENMLQYLNERNIFPGIHYPLPCHLQKAYSALGYKKGDLPNAEFLSDHCLSLPMFPELTDAEIERVIDAVNTFRG